MNIKPAILLLFALLPMCAVSPATQQALVDAGIRASTDLLVSRLNSK